ncbi:MerR family transcriptional regulator [Herbihabitans rhizosphaerae]|nr:MerR family transcriptional regulator [Herbihabitans rhizosphaerae]
MTDPGVRIGDAAALYGLAPSTLRWWERQGVFAAPRLRGGQRVYRDEDLRRIGLAYLCHVTGGMPLDGAAVVTSGKAENEVWQETVRDEIGRLGQRIEELRASRDYLGHLLCCTDDDPALCRYLDPELVKHTPRGRVPALGLVEAARTRGPAPEPARDDSAARDAKRDESPACEVCGHSITVPERGRPRRYCSRACRQRAYRARRRASRSSRYRHSRAPE